MHQVTMGFSRRKGLTLGWCKQCIRLVALDAKWWDEVKVRECKRMNHSCVKWTVLYHWSCFASACSCLLRVGMNPHGVRLEVKHKCVLLLCLGAVCLDINSMSMSHALQASSKCSRCSRCCAIGIQLRSAIEQALSAARQADAALQHVSAAGTALN